MPAEHVPRIFMLRSLHEYFSLRIVSAVHAAPQDDGFADLARADEDRLGVERHAAVSAALAYLGNQGPLPSAISQPEGDSRTDSIQRNDILRSVRFDEMRDEQRACRALDVSKLHAWKPRCMLCAVQTNPAIARQWVWTHHSIGTAVHSRISPAFELAPGDSPG